MKTALLAFGVLGLAGCVGVQPPVRVASGAISIPSVKPALVQAETHPVAPVPDAKPAVKPLARPLAKAPGKPAARKPGIELPPEKLSAALIPKPPSKVSPVPSDAEICRAGLALSKNRKLVEVKVQENVGGVFAVSYVPWPGAPADARLFKCRLAGKSVVLGEVRGAKVKWSSERISWGLDPAQQELTLRVTYAGTGKTRTQVHLFSALRQECNGCEGYRAAAPHSAKATTEKPKNPINSVGGATGAASNL